MLTNLVRFQFGGQAPGTSEQQRQAAFDKFGFEFDVMDKLLVNGEGAHPLYRYLRGAQPTSVPRNSRSPAGSNAIEWCVRCPARTPICKRVAVAIR